MDDLRLQAVAARVVAWHNRHPLARRITAAQVKSVGYVGFGVPPAQAAMLGDEHAADSAPVQPVQAAGSAATGMPSAPAPMSTPVAAAAAALTAAAAAGPAEDDFAQAFAELAEMAAVEDQAAVSTLAVSEPATEKPPTEQLATPPSSAVEVEIDAPAAGTEAARDGALEIELDAAPASDPPLPAEAPAAAETVVEAPVVDPAATPATPATPPPAATPAAEAADLEVAVLDAPAHAQASASALPADGAKPGAAPAPTSPAAPATPPGSSLRDRVLNRRFRGVAAPGSDGPLHTPSATGVQGAMLATHDGYRPAAAHEAVQHAAALAVAEPAHSENFMAPLSPRAVARWVTQQGRVLLQPPADGPVRLVGGSAFAASGASGPMYVMTAAVEGGSLRSRLLVGAGSPGQVLGTRLYSLPRVAVAAGLGVGLLLAMAVVATALLRPPAPKPLPHDEQAAPAATAASAAASAPEAAASAATPADAASALEAAVSVSAASAAAHGDTALAHGNTHDAAPASSSTNTAAASQGDAHTALPGHTPPAETRASPAPAQPELKITTERPLTAYAQRGRLDLPQRGSVLSDEDKAAVRQSVADARAALGRAAPGGVAGRVAGGGSAHAAPTSDGAAGHTAAPAAVPTGPVFAVSTRPLRTRAEAEQVQAAMNALLRTTGAGPVKTELLPEGEDWRVVAWPFGSQSQANDARALLVSRGMRVQVVGF